MLPGSLLWYPCYFGAREVTAVTLHPYTMKHKIAICLTGWYFNEDVYRQLFEVASIDIFVVVHKQRDQVPAFLFEQIPEERIIFQKNIGYDWGSYQQFIATGLWREYDFIFFMHDDLAIKSLDFIPHTIDLLQAGKKVVGNGRNAQYLNWPHSHPFCYGHSTWLPPSRQFQHDTIRGSFLAMNSNTLKKINHFEIFWDPYHLTVRFGNHSLIATCGKIQALFGESSFGFLSETYLDSEYMTELERGGQSMPTPSLGQRVIINFYNKISAYYVDRRMKQAEKEWNVSVAAHITRKISGVL